LGSEKKKEKRQKRSTQKEKKGLEWSIRVGQRGKGKVCPSDPIKKKPLGKITAGKGKRMRKT